MWGAVLPDQHRTDSADEAVAELHRLRARGSCARIARLPLTGPNSAESVLNGGAMERSGQRGSRPEALGEVGWQKAFSLPG